MSLRRENLKLSEVARQHRLGPLLVHAGRVDVPPRLLSDARTVQRVDSVTWRAQSPSQAAAWLIVLGHEAAVIPKYSLLVDGPTTKARTEFHLGFRGQSARYALLPTICRPGVDRQAANRASAWCRGVLDTWAAECLPRYSPIEDEYVGPKLSSYWFGWEEAGAVARHYGVPMNYLDWTLDPLIALAFAAGCSTGEVAAVLFAGFGGGTAPNVMLPPTPVTRLWRQRGFFTYHPCPDEADDPLLLETGMSQLAAARADVANYWRILFTVDDEAARFSRRMKQALMPLRDPLHGLVQWCQNIAREHSPPAYWYRGAIPRSLGALVDDVEESAPGFETPPIDATQKVRNDAAAIASYVDHLALAYDARSEQAGYATSHLSLFLSSVAGSYPSRFLPPGDPRFDVLRRHEADPNYLDEVVRLDSGVDFLAVPALIQAG